MTSGRWISGFLCVLVGCGGSSEAEKTPEASPSEADVPVANAIEMSPGEMEVIMPLLESFRNGVNPRGEQGIGICRGQGPTCEEFLGSTPGELPPGVYTIRAELDVPTVGRKWRANFEADCEITMQYPSGEVKRTSEHEKTYRLAPTGDKQGFRLNPLLVITSPSKAGAQECEFSLTLPHSAGEEKVFTGSWSVPAQVEEP